MTQTGRRRLPRSCAFSSPEMTAAIEEMDWSNTLLGDQSTWTPALRTLLEAALTNRFPVVLWWGPSFVQLYNDAAVPMFGEKHPRSLGQSARETWPEIWDAIGGQLEGVYRTGESTWNEDLLLVVNRYGFNEETYFTFSYSALPDADAPNHVGGVMSTVQETTGKVITSARMTMLRDLASVNASTVADACNAAVSTFGKYDALVPFSLLYLVDREDPRTARLVAGHNVQPGSQPAPMTVPLDTESGPWPLGAARASGKLTVVDSLSDRLEMVPRGPWPDPPNRAVIAPLRTNDGNSIGGFLVAGTNPQLPFDQRHREFFELIEGEIASALARARAFEAAQQRAEIRRGVERWFQEPGIESTDEAIFRAMADQLPVMVYLQDAAGGISFVNEMWHTWMLMPRDKSTQTLERWVEVVHPGDLPVVLASVTDAIAGQEPYAAEYRIKPLGSSDEEYRWHLVRAAPRIDAKGAFAGWIGSIVDIHDAHVREETERALREIASSNAREFRALADIVPVMMWMADATGNVEWYNQRWYEYTGQTEEEALGWGWQAVHHHGDLPAVLESWPRSLQTGEPWEMEFRLRRYDGEFHTFLTRAVPVRDERGQIVRWYGSNVDMQTQHEVLERTRRVAQTLQRVFLPAQLPHTSNMHVAAVYKAAESDALIGGDWLDAVELPDGRYLFSIGDVTGHGLDASVIAGRLRHAIVDFGLECADPALVLQRANNVLRLEHENTYATALVAFVDAECSRLTFASAGHPPPACARRGAPAQFLPYGGMPLGIEPTLALHSHEIDIQPDTVVAFYTDGITEADRNLDAAELRLSHAVAKLAEDHSIAAPAEFLRDAVLGARRTVDDTAMLVLRFTTAALAGAPADKRPLRKVWRFHSSDAYSARVARQELMRFVRRYTDDRDGIFASELILGELLANTVEHAPGLVEIDIDWTADEPVLRVADAGPGLSAVPQHLPSDDLSEGGRGLFLIQSLARDLKIAPLGSVGTEVRVKLPLQTLRREHGRVPRTKPRR